MLMKAPEVYKCHPAFPNSSSGEIVEERRASSCSLGCDRGTPACLSLPSCPLRESSQPQLSKSPRLQFRVSVYMTPAELMAWTKAVSRFAVKWEDKKSKCAKDFVARPVLEMTLAMQETGLDEVCNEQGFAGQRGDPVC